MKEFRVNEPGNYNMVPDVPGHAKCFTSIYVNYVPNWSLFHGQNIMQ